MLQFYWLILSLIIIKDALKLIKKAAYWPLSNKRQFRKIAIATKQTSLYNRKKQSKHIQPRLEPHLMRFLGGARLNWSLALQRWTNRCWR